MLDFASLNRATDALSGWQSLAARDGAFSVYHFGKTIDAISVAYKNCTAVLAAKIDGAKLRAGSRTFSRSFPSREAVRNVVGHVAESASSTEQREKHSFTGPREFQVG